jgi:prepilin-type N-terminal cleavage/methylation domain-containing protein
MYTSASQSGFTLVEMIVSLTLFSVVITISIGALLSLIGSNDQLRSEQTVMTNLAFALDSMTREIRTGSYYNCGPSVSNLDTATYNQDGLGTTTEDCLGVNNRGLSFIEGGDSITGVARNRIAYYFDDTNNRIMRRVGGGPSNQSQSMTADDIHIEDMRIWVTSSDTLSSGDTRQPTVTIFIEARESATGESYYVQTTVTQRSLDL